MAKAPAAAKAAKPRASQAEPAKIVTTETPPATPPASGPAPSVVKFEPPTAEFEAVMAEIGRLSQLRGVSIEELSWQAMRSGVKALAADVVAPSVLLPETPPEGMIRVRVIGPKQGRWRGGRHFSSEPSIVDVNQDELDAIERDPALSHELVAG